MYEDSYLIINQFFYNFCNRPANINDAILKSVFVILNGLLKKIISFLESKYKNNMRC